MDVSHYQNYYTYVLRSQSLVYCGHPISASSYYHDFLTANKWQDIKFSDIDWHTDHVFGFVMNPERRHIQGLATDWYTNANPDFVDAALSEQNKIFKLLAIFSWHSLPLNLIYGDYLRKIDWIPLDLDPRGKDSLVPNIATVDPDYLLKKLTHYYHIGLDFQSSERIKRKSLERNLLNPRRQKLTDKIQHLINHASNGSGSNALWLGLHKDLELYNDVVQNTHHWHQDWPQISWLKNLNSV
jgi:hypothetical protein